MYFVFWRWGFLVQGASSCVLNCQTIANIYSTNEVAVTTGPFTGISDPPKEPGKQIQAFYRGGNKAQRDQTASEGPRGGRPGFKPSFSQVLTWMCAQQDGWKGGKRKTW